MTKYINNYGNAQNKEHERKPIDLEKTIRKSGVGTKNDNNHLKPSKTLSFKEFENHITERFDIQKGDIGATDYIKEKYQEYLAKGKIEASWSGLQMHKSGFLVDKFKKDNPNLSKGIKLAVDITGKAVGILVDGTVYVLNPLKPVWEVYRDSVNALVPDMVKEWMNNKEKGAKEGFKNWEGGLTSKQKVVLDTSIEGVKFASDITIVGSVVKLAGKLIIEDGLKVVTKVDKPNIKPHTDAGDLTHPSTPVGHKEKEILVQSGTNTRSIIGGREYSGHALDRMQERGLTPTMIDHVIQNGGQFPGNVPNRILHYDAVNKVTVVTENGNVITVIFGGKK